MGCKRKERSVPTRSGNPNLLKEVKKSRLSRPGEDKVPPLVGTVTIRVLRIVREEQSQLDQVDHWETTQSTRVTNTKSTSDQEQGRYPIAK